MANYYTDIPELKYHLNNPMMERICELKERNYRDKEEFDYAFVNVARKDRYLGFKSPHETIRSTFSSIDLSK